MFRDFAANTIKQQELEEKIKELQPLENELKIFLQTVAPKGIQIIYAQSDRIDTLRFDDGKIIIGEL